MVSWMPPREFESLHISTRTSLRVTQISSAIVWSRPERADPRRDLPLFRSSPRVPLPMSLFSEGFSTWRRRMERWTSRNTFSATWDSSPFAGGGVEQYLEALDEARLRKAYRESFLSDRRRSRAQQIASLDTLDTLEITPEGVFAFGDFLSAALELDPPIPGSRSVLQRLTSMDQSVTATIRKRLEASRDARPPSGVCCSKR